MNFRDLAAETLQLVSNGGYTLGVYNVKIPKSTKGVFHIIEDTEKLILSGLSNCTVYPDVRYQLKNESTVDAIFRVKSNKIGVLNFASAHHPGGGFLNGAMAQEEALAYCSDLYETLVDNQFYMVHDKIKSKMYSDSMIIGDVTFFRTGDYKLVTKPKVATVLTSAAVNMGQVIAHGEDSLKAQEVMKGRMRKVLYMLANSGCESIILGAFGCGVFGNDPNMVANTWVDLLVGDGLQKYFKEIVFSVYDRAKDGGNYRVFKEVFESRNLF